MSEATPEQEDTPPYEVEVDEDVETSPPDHVADGEDLDLMEHLEDLEIALPEDEEL